MLAAADFDTIRSFFKSLSTYPSWQVAIELLIIGSIVFWVVKFLQGTRGARLLRGIILLLVVLWLFVITLGNVLDLGRVQWLYETVLGGIWFAIAIAFQPELRRALMRLGETRLFRTIAPQLNEQIDAMVETALFCSRRKIGALIAIEREVGLGGLAENGTRLNADVSSALLNTIFWPNSPLHDLGVIISHGKVSTAGVQFPLAESGDLEKELGSRHRAAVGMSQETDAVVLVVSEETGDISIAERGTLFRKLTPDALRDILSELLGGSGNKPAKEIVQESSPSATIVNPMNDPKVDPSA